MKDIIYSCHQPNFFPWIGYFHKIMNSDIFVILDEVQYTKNSVANRNKIKSAQGEQFITVPRSKKFNNSSFFTYRQADFAQKNWYIKVIKSIEQSYKKSKYFDQYKDVIFDILKAENFCELNINFIKFILSELDIKTQILLMSEISGLSGKNNDLLIEIGLFLKANVYLSGNGARAYNDVNKFMDNGISIKYQVFEHPTYEQLYPPFIPFLSVLDLLFNEGKSSKHFLINKN